MSTCLVETSYHLELIDGLEVQKPLPKRLHFLIQAFLVVWFRHELPDGFDVGSELNVLCGEDRLVPDVVVAKGTAQYRDGDLADPAVLAVEMLSPGQTINDLMDKCNRLLKSGTGTCWVIWPEKRRALTYTLDDLVEADHLAVFFQDANGVRTSLSLPVATMWAELDRRGV